MKLLTANRKKWLPVGRTGYEVSMGGDVRRKGQTKILKPSSNGQVWISLGSRDNRVQRFGKSLAISAMTSALSWGRDRGEYKI